MVLVPRHPKADMEVRAAAAALQALILGPLKAVALQALVVLQAGALELLEAAR